MNGYVWLLLWQAVACGAAFWIVPSGWLWFVFAVALVLFVEWALSAFAKKRGIQDFSTPFKGSKYMEDLGLFLVQCGFTAVLSLVVLAALSMQGSWNVFWIVLGVDVVCIVGAAVSVSRNKK